MVVDFFKALAEESRLRILALLLLDEMCVCEIEEYLKMTQSNVSRHLTVLKNCGILDSYKEAQWAYYKISEKFKEENPNLWIYLVEELKKSSKYYLDIEVIQNSIRHDLCDSKTT